VTAREALALVRQHGIMTESYRGPVPSLAASVVGGPISGSWWGHAKAHEIFALSRAVRRNADILVCRLVEGRITYVHRRLWPHVVRMAPRLSRGRLTQLQEIHTATGKHVVRETPFPEWVPEPVLQEASRLTEQQARDALGFLLPARRTRTQRGVPR
jgi:hypothetical protein